MKNKIIVALALVALAFPVSTFAQGLFQSQDVAAIRLSNLSWDTAGVATVKFVDAGVTCYEVFAPGTAGAGNHIQDADAVGISCVPTPAIPVAPVTVLSTKK